MVFSHSLEQDKDTERFLEVNMTPLIGVLLMLMMVMIAGVAPKRNILLMDIGTSWTSGCGIVGISIDIDFDDTLFWNGVAISEKELQQRLIRIAPEQPEIHLRPYSMASHAAVIAATNSLRNAGINDIYLITTVSRPFASQHFY